MTTPPPSDRSGGWPNGSAAIPTSPGSDMSNRIEAIEVIDDVIDIGALLPHRGAMLLVDRITEHSPTRVVGEHEVTGDAFWAGGHFPGLPVLPGILFGGPDPAAASTPIDASDAADPSTAGEPIGVLAVVRRCSFRRLVTPPATLVGTVVGAAGTGAGPGARRAATFDFRIESSRAVVADGSVTLALTGPGPTTGGLDQRKETLA
jgi:3-hydroxymyristoyl/3-hydroxydecanoyl-(acyl carrier protein) dehydratase